MAFSSVVVMKGINPTGPTKILPSDDPDQILIAQADKVLLASTEDLSISHTWYLNQKKQVSKIQGVARSFNSYEKAEAIISVGSDIILASTAQQKLSEAKSEKPFASSSSSSYSDSVRLNLTKPIFDVVTHLKEHIIVFEDGTIENLAYYMKQSNKDASTELTHSKTSHLPGGSTLKDCSIVEESGVTQFVQLVENGEKLDLITGRLVINSDTSAYSMEAVVTSSVMNCDDVLAWDITTHTYQGLALFILKKDGWLGWISLTGKALRKAAAKPSDVNLTLNDVIKLELPQHADIKVINQHFCAVMYTKKGNDAGQLDLVSIPYSIVATTTSLKATVHSGRGLWFVNGRIYMVGGGKLSSCLPTDTSVGLDAFIGCTAKNSFDDSSENSSIQLYKTVPKLIRDASLDQLVSTVKEAIDLPEQLLMETILFVINQDIMLEKKDEILRTLLTKEFSEPLMSGEVHKLKIDEALHLLEVISQFLEGEKDLELEEARLLSWSNLILNSHYVRIRLSKDNKTLSAITKYQTLLDQLQNGVEALVQSRSLVHGMTSIKVAVQEETNQPYYVELIQL